MSVNTNIQSLNAQRNLTSSQNSLATSMQRLSSGLRINSAKDDAAGLAISERMSTQVRGLNQAARNANDGISLAQTAEGALSSVGNNLQRIRELAVQSRNATNSSQDRQALDAEVQQLKSEIQRVAEQTSFNGTKLLDGSFMNQAFQVGADQGQVINIATIANANTTDLGNWTSVATSSSTTGAVAAGTGYVAAAPAVATTTLSSGAYTPAASTTATDAFQFKIDGATVSDRLVGDATATNLDTDINAFIAASNGAYTKTGSVATSDLVISKADGTDLAIATSFSNAVGSATAAAGTTSGGTFATAGFVGTATNGTEAVAGTPASFGALSGDALTINGINIEVAASGNATQRASDLVKAINNQSTATNGVSASLVDGKVQLRSANGDITIGGTSTDLTALTGLTAGTTAGGALTGSTAYAAGSAQVGFATMGVATTEQADNAILAMDAALNAVNGARADLGAIQNRFITTIENLQTSSENLTASRSRIMDADFAAETANLSRAQILQQAGTAMVAQANQLPQQVLSLLQG
jgi:flagellin